MPADPGRTSYDLQPSAVELDALSACSVTRLPAGVVIVDGVSDRQIFAAPITDALPGREMAQGAAHPSGAEHPGEVFILRQLHQLALRAAVPAAKILKHRAA